MVKEVLRVFDESTTKKEIYRITHAKTATQMRELEDGAIIDPVNFILYTDENQKGEENTVLAIVDANGDIITTISATLRNDFMDMVENFGLDFMCKKTSGLTKAGREFVTVEMCE